MSTPDEIARAAIATATPLALNDHLSPAVLNAITAGGPATAAGSGLAFASGTITSLAETHWFKIVHQEPAGTSFKFRTYFLQPSTDEDKELLVHMVALNREGEFITAPGAGTSVGSTVAHGATAGAPSLSTAPFPVSGDSVTYYFNIQLLADGTPPSGPYVFLAFKL